MTAGGSACTLEGREMAGMFDDDANDGDGRTDTSPSGHSLLVSRTRRTLTVSDALEERLRATGHVRGYAAATDQDMLQLATLAARPDDLPEQRTGLRREGASAYQADRGCGLVRAAFRSTEVAC